MTFSVMSESISIVLMSVLLICEEVYALIKAAYGKS